MCVHAKMYLYGYIIFIGKPVVDDSKGYSYWTLFLLSKKIIVVVVHTLTQTALWLLLILQCTLYCITYTFVFCYICFIVVRLLVLYNSCDKFTWGFRVASLAVGRPYDHPVIASEMTLHYMGRFIHPAMYEYNLPTKHTTQWKLCIPLGRTAYMQDQFIPYGFV